jgi:hypothetical protein
MIIDAPVERYCAAHPDIRPSALYTDPNARTVRGVGKVFGLDLWIEEERGSVGAIARLNEDGTQMRLIV